jgi:alanine-glyoxylate transaminase / serine-glyoxylate transaminase / serine-pyruvate transaminase
VWESVVENLAAPGEAVLVPGTGHFSEQWALQTEALGRRVVRTEWAEGQPIDVAAVEAALRDDRAHGIRAVFAVHTDTASSITNDLAALRCVLDATGHPALLVADCVASLGCTPVDMPGWGCDVVLGASQKGLMSPPGVGIVAVNARALAAAAACAGPRFYWDWQRRTGEMNYQKFCGTPPLNLMAAMEAALRLIDAEGAEAVFARHRRLACAVHAAVQGWATAGALGFVAERPETRSVSVTAIRTPEGLDIDHLRAVARDHYQLGIAGGLGPLRGRAFRIGHLGDGNEAVILGAIGAAEATLRHLGVPVGDGVGAAVKALVAARAHDRA